MKTQGSYVETLGDIIESRPVLKLLPEDFLSDALERMRADGEKAAGVVDAGGCLAGLITENNILRRILPRFKRWPTDIAALCKHKAIEGLIVLDVMIPEPDILHVDDRVEDALDVMTYLSHPYMPVTDSEGRLSGIVSHDELKRMVEKKYGALKCLDDPVSLYMIQQKLGDLNLGYSQTL